MEFEAEVGLEGEAGWSLEGDPQVGLRPWEGEEQPGRFELRRALPADLAIKDPRLARPSRSELTILEGDAVLFSCCQTALSRASLAAATSIVCSLWSTQTGHTFVSVSTNTFITSCMSLMHFSIVSLLSRLPECKVERWATKFLQVLMQTQK